METEIKDRLKTDVRLKLDYIKQNSSKTSENEIAWTHGSTQFIVGMINVMRHIDYDLAKYWSAELREVKSQFRLDENENS